MTYPYPNDIAVRPTVAAISNTLDKRNIARFRQDHNDKAVVKLMGRSSEKDMGALGRHSGSASNGGCANAADFSRIYGGAQLREVLAAHRHSSHGYIVAVQTRSSLLSVRTLTWQSEQFELPCTRIIQNKHNFKDVPEYLTGYMIECGHLSRHVTASVLHLFPSNPCAGAQTWNNTSASSVLQLPFSSSHDISRQWHSKNALSKLSAAAAQSNTNAIPKRAFRLEIARRKARFYESEI